MFPTLLHTKNEKEVIRSQSPQIGSMFLTRKEEKMIKTGKLSQSPQIGSMFLTWSTSWGASWFKERRRNPLKSGQCFLHSNWDKWVNRIQSNVAIPSNRVNVSYLPCRVIKQRWEKISRNPLKSGQCFLLHPSFLTDYRKLNTPFSGTSLFLYFLFPYLTYLLQ